MLKASAVAATTQEDEPQRAEAGEHGPSCGLGDGGELVGIVIVDAFGAVDVTIGEDQAEIVDDQGGFAAEVVVGKKLRAPLVPTSWPVA